ncbi:antibiotic biosynthesis monooxygenase [Jonesiaceae bacterium BS-20]|uniref:Antibiotic biosynthesis monooxygenase n=1 Tax=Jonesiaceae bacterium BS-20 TaxID=3120821 RepID=A0AAU7E0J1_9MICO
MTTIRLTGQLICKSANEVAIVMEFLPVHIELTRAEPGCISFEVEQGPNPLIWAVAETFQDAESFALHQARVKASKWGRATAGIERNYTVIGL